MHARCKMVSRTHALFSGTKTCPFLVGIWIFGPTVIYCSGRCWMCRQCAGASEVRLVVYAAQQLGVWARDGCGVVWMDENDVRSFGEDVFR